MLQPLRRQPLLDVGKHLIALLIQRRRCGVDPLKLLFCREAGFVVHAVRIDNGDITEAAHANHIELIKIAGKDRQELQPLEQRHTLILRLCQHARVELQP